MATSLARPQRRQGPALTSRRLLALLDDDRLSREVAKGNEAAFEVIYDRHHRGLLSFCRHLLGSREEAEDALQQTFVSAYDHLTRAGAIKRLKPWLYTIARNRCISMIRARREEPAEDVEPSTDGLQQEVQQRADLMQLLGDLQRLAVDQRAALVLSELKGLSHRDVAEILECDTVKVKALVFQARSHLIDYRAARETPCVDVRREIAARKRGAPSGMVRRHVAVCADCAVFREQVREQRRALALVLPVLPAAGLRAKALVATAAGGGGSSAASGGAWLVAHSQAVKLAALGAAALTAGAITVPLLSGGSQPARAGDSPQAVAAPVPSKLATGGRVSSPATGGHVKAAAHHRRAAHASHPGAASHARHRHRAATTTVRHRHTVRHRQATAPAQPSHRGQGHAYAYGHLHAPGWLRHHGVAASPRRGPKHRHR